MSPERRHPPTQTDMEDREPKHEALELIRRLLEMGAVPRSVKVSTDGSVEVVLHTIERQRDERPAQPGSYLERAIMGQRPRSLGGDR